MSYTRAQYPLKLTQLQTRVDVYKYSFLPRTVIQWNSLQIPNIDTIDLETFKNAVSRKLPYTNHKVIDLKHKKETLWKRFRRTGNHLDHLRFTEVRNSLRRLTRDLRSKFEMRIAKEVKTNPKAFGDM